MPVIRSQSSREKWAITEVASNTQQNNKKRPRGQLSVESGEKSCVDLTPANKKKKGKEPKEENQHFFRDLPTEVLENIFKNLDTSTLLQLDLVSKTFETDTSILGALHQVWKVIHKQTYEGVWWKCNENKKNPYKWNYFLSRALVHYLSGREEGVLKWQNTIGKIQIFIQHCPAFIACIQFDCQTFRVPLPTTFPSADRDKKDVKQILANVQHKDGQGEFLLTILPHITKWNESEISLKSKRKKRRTAKKLLYKQLTKKIWLHWKN